MIIERINIGQIILDLIRERGLTKAQFAQLLGMQRQNIDKNVLKKSSLDTDLLCRISEVLDVNLFSCYCKAKGDTEVTATLTVGMGLKKGQKSFKIILGDNELLIEEA